MRREIKFRAWSHGMKADTPSRKRAYGEWVFPPQMMYDEKPGDCLVWKRQGQNIEVMQYTGLKDRNGKEIYEGDILDDSKESPLVVKYNQKCATFELVSDKSSYIFPEIYWLELHVIGNIYENPELAP